MNITKLTVLAASLLLALTIFTACEKTEYSPYEVRLAEHQKDLNQKNIERILARFVPEEDTLRFVLTADTQKRYTETREMVASVNQLSGISFVLHGGDITDFGIIKEFKWMDDILSGLKVPYLTVIGNHDCVANGKKVYKAMYGDFDYSFRLGGQKFIFLNTNFLEFDEHIPRLDWLAAELKDTASFTNAFVISHVPPNDRDANKAKEQEYARLMREGKVRLSIHGHRHNHEFGQFYNDGVDYLVIGSPEKGYYQLVTVVGTKATYETIYF